MAYQLRKFQSDNKSDIREGFRVHRSILYQAGTGSGKTVTASSIVKDAVAKGTTTWFLAHRRELIEQTSDTFHKDGIRNGIIMAEHRYQPSMPVQICSIDTLRERFVKNDKMIVFQKPGLIITDEARRGLSPSYINLYAKFPNAYMLGLDATPVRSDGRGLGHIYDHMVQAPPISELQALGYLVPMRYFTGATPDLQGVRTDNYDYAAGPLQEAYDDADLRGDVVEQWIRHAQNRKTIVFASGVRHSMALRDDFLARGIAAIHIDGHTLTHDRMDMFDDFRHTDKYKVLVNCNIATEGVDIPEVGCVQVATATKAISKYMQMGGRGMRPHEASGKKDCIFIDHGGNIERHGFLEDPVPWSLDTTGRIGERIAEVRDDMPKIFTCSNCGCEFSGQIRCPECKTKLEVQPYHELINTPEELIEVTRGVAGMEATEKQKVYSNVQKRNFHAQLLGYAMEKNFKTGYVFHKYRAKFGQPPPDHWMADPPQEPSELVRAFLRGQAAAHAIRKKYREEKQAELKGAQDG